MVDRMERNKDLLQELVEATATRVGRIASIVTTAVADIAREIGDLVSDGFEMRDAARRAELDHETSPQAATVTADEPTRPERNGERDSKIGVAEIESAESDLANSVAAEIKTDGVEPFALEEPAGDGADIPPPALPVTPEVEAEIEDEFDG